jgi:hypothetical protein
VHSRRLSTFDFERLLIELVERLASDYETELGIAPVVKAVRRARDELGNLGVDAPDGGIDRIERAAREQLNAMGSSTVRSGRGDGLEAGLVGS